jgi:atypical dual specificity phosphatase
VDFPPKGVKAPKGCRVRVGGITPDLIIPGLWLGALEAARNRHFLTRHGITHVLSILDCECSFFPGLFKYKFIQAKDHSDQDLIPIFNEVATFIDEGIEEGGIVVHCVMGVSRSASLVIAYIMRTKKMSYREAYDLVKRKRDVIYPNDGFKGQLMQYEESLKREEKGGGGKDSSNCAIS